MSQTLFEKLEFEEEKNILIQGLPSTIEKEFSKVSFSKNVTPLLRRRKIDFALVFVLNENHLKSILNEICPALHDDTKLWIASPKSTSKILTNLSRKSSWECVLNKGLKAGEEIELDYVWRARRYRSENCTEPEEKEVAEVAEAAVTE